MHFLDLHTTKEQNGFPSHEGRTATKPTVRWRASTGT
ncbi:hypothetical protein A2U01_0108120, partial [Trifolium medium]|nr:hypothetical protein [Trifolium medium]